MDIDEIFRQVRQGADINTSDNLVDDYMLDSYDLIVLIEEISKNYNVQIGADDFNMDNFLNKQSILDMIERNR